MTHHPDLDLDLEAAVDRALAQARAVCAAETERHRILAETTVHEHEQFLQEASQQGRSRAEAARSGEHGPDAQRLQARLDAGVTTPSAVQDGRDTDSSAQAGRQRWQETLTVWAEHPWVQAQRAEEV